MAHLLLSGGRVLLHDDQDQIQVQSADILIHGSVITAIGCSLETPDSNTRVLDCSGKIISPGFIDTHHHVWQTALKGKHANQTLVEYLPWGNSITTFLSPADIFWGQLSGALEALDAGTTTVVDHAHLSASPSHVEAAIRATLTSSIRSVFCYTPTFPLESWVPLKMDGSFPDWIMQTFEQLAAKSPMASSSGDPHRLMMGFGLLSPGRPKEFLQSVFDKARKAKAQVITTHSNAGPIFGKNPGGLETLGQHGLLGPDVIIAHSNRLLLQEADLLKQSGAFISSTPTTELQMGMNQPVALSPYPGAVDPTARTPNVSLGIDCHSVVSSSMPNQMAVALTYARAQQHAQLTQSGRWTPSLLYRHKSWKSLEGKTASPDPSPPFPALTVQDAFNLGTVCGARAIGKDEELGRISVGFKADLAVFDATSPGMLAAAEEDPVAAIVMHSSVRDVFGTIVGGDVCKWDGVLVDTEAASDFARSGVGPTAGTRITWPRCAREVLDSRTRIDKAVEGVDMDRVAEEVVNFFPMDKGAIA